MLSENKTLMAQYLKGIIEKRQGSCITYCKLEPDWHFWITYIFNQSTSYMRTVVARTWDSTVNIMPYFQFETLTNATFLIF